MLICSLLIYNYTGYINKKIRGRAPHTKKSSYQHVSTVTEIMA